MRTTLRVLLAFVLAVGPMIAARAADDALPAAIDRVRGSVVAIGTSEPTRNPSFQFRGTGFVVGDGTFIATNSHVVPSGTDAAARETLSVAIPTTGGDATVREAFVVSRDPEHDIALLRVGGPPLPALRIGDSSKVREGQLYAFTGFPIGGVLGLYATTHRASISAITPDALVQASARSLNPALIRKLRAERFPVFQLDAIAYPGNSGSPMFDPATGDVVAVINGVLVKAGKESALTSPTGISYAIPAVHIVRLLDAARNAVR